MKQSSINGENEVKCECDGCIKTLRDVPCYYQKLADYSSKRGIS